MAERTGTIDGKRFREINGQIFYDNPSNAQERTNNLRVLGVDDAMALHGDSVAAGLANTAAELFGSGFDSRGRNPETGEPFPEIPSLFRDAVEDQRQASPGGFATGEGLGTMATMMAAGTGAGAFMRAKNIMQAPGFINSAGRTATEAVAEAMAGFTQGFTIGDASEQVIEDLEAAAAIASLGKGLSMVPRVAATIAGMRKKSRDVRPGASPNETGQVQRLQDQGFEITEGQASGDPTIIGIEKGAKSQPLTRGPFDEINNANQVKFNQQVGNAMGVDGADALTPEMLDTRGTELGEIFGNIGNEVGDQPINPDMVDSFNRLNNKRRPLTQETRAVIDENANFLFGKVEEGLPITPEDYATIRRDMNDGFRQASQKGDRVDAEAYEEAVNLLDAHVIETLSNRGEGGRARELLAELQSTREQYRVWKTVTVPNVTKNGNVSPQALKNKLQQPRSFGETFTLNRDRIDREGGSFVVNQETRDLFDTVRGFNTTRMVPPPTSGTAENLALTNMTRNAVSVIGEGLANPKGLVSRAAAAATIGATPRLLQTPDPSKKVTDILEALGIGAGILATEDER